MGLLAAFSMAAAPQKVGLTLLLSQGRLLLAAPATRFPSDRAHTNP